VVEAQALAAGRFARDYPTVFDGVVGPWFVETFLAATKLDALAYAVLLPDVEVCVERVLAREGHVFRNEEAARKMHHEFSRVELDGRHVIVNHSTAEDAADDVIARWVGGELVLGPSR